VRAGRFVVAVFVALAAVGVGCRALRNRYSEAETMSAEAIAVRIGCTVEREIDALEAPIRGGAASRGIACAKGDVEVHVFERAPVGDLDDSDESYASAQGGTLENIDRLLGTHPTTGCAWLAVGGSWFLLSPDRRIAQAAGKQLGSQVREPQRTTPPASYQPPGGCPQG
jgi:hypothetical protein